MILISPQMGPGERMFAGLLWALCALIAFLVQLSKNKE